MNLKEVLDCKVFAVAGDTVNEEKFAAKIKAALEARGLTAYGVGKELPSFDAILEEIDVIDLCIRSERALALLKATEKSCKCVVVQPGVESPELLQWLQEHQIPHIEGCLLAAMKQYPKKS